MPAPTPDSTRVVLILTAVALGLYDLWALATAGPPATISRVFLRWSEEFPILLVGLGLLLGHLFLRQAP
jgi:hypothetical protein